MPLNFLISIVDERYFEIYLLQNADNFHTKQQANLDTNVTKLAIKRTMFEKVILQN